MTEELKQRIANRLVLVFVVALVAAVLPSAIHGYHVGGFVTAVHDSIYAVQTICHDIWS